MIEAERRANIAANRQAVKHAVRVIEAERRLRPNYRRFDYQAPRRAAKRPSWWQALTAGERDAMKWLAVLFVALLLLRQ